MITCPRISFNLLRTQLAFVSTGDFIQYTFVFSTNNARCLGDEISFSKIFFGGCSTHATSCPMSAGTDDIMIIAFKSTQ
jgi:hypothetical protein